MFLEETDLDIGVADRTHLFRLLIEVIFTEYALLVGSIVFSFASFAGNCS